MKKVLLSCIIVLGVFTLNGCSAKSAHEKWASQESR